MKSRRILAILVLALSLMVCSAKVAKAEPIGTAFTYQGFLVDNKKPAEGQYDFQFRLFNTDVGDNVVGSNDVNALDVNDGYFALELDFGDGIFTGDKRWLQISTRKSAVGGNYTPLAPRLELTLTPYALYALSAEDANTVDGHDANAFALSNHDHNDRYYTEAELQSSGSADVNWYNLSGVPTGFADGVDDVGGVPLGVIVMWSGSIDDIPEGWALCDGGVHNGVQTPDLRDMFIVGAGNSYDVNDIGGAAFHTLTIAEIPPHTHTESGHGGWPGCACGGDPVGHSQTTQTGSTGDNQPHENRPPFYALAFIMHIGE